MNLMFKILILSPFIITGGSALLTTEVKWTHELDLETGFQVKWDSEDPDFLTMEISAPTTGYLGVGFSPYGNMIDSDIVIAWVDSDKIPHLKDYHGVGKTDPIEDAQQDYFLIAAAERDNRTTVRFYRRWVTCDEEHDIKIENDTMRLIWAWHPEDPQSNPSFSFPWHGVTFRGTKNVYMRLPNRPMAFPDGEDGLGQPPSHVKLWDLTVEDVDIEGSRNAIFMCKLFRFPHINQKFQRHHLIGFRPLITEENEQNIYRISLYQCHTPEGLGDTEKWFQKHLDGKTRECQTTDTPNEWARHCTNFLFSWALGSEGEMLPTHVGIPLGDRSGKSTYYKLEVQYDNLSGKQFLDSSGIRVFYTDHTRMYDGGSFLVGHRVSPFLAIPPAQEGFKIYSICSSDCTRNSIPEGGLNVVGVMLHAHETGKKLRLRHVRNGKELSPLAEDSNFTHKYQQYRIMKDEVRIFPGDSLLMECEYNTLHRDQFTFGGSSDEGEMCQALLLYYPRANLTACESKPEFQSFFAGFGIRSIMGEGLRRIENHPQEVGGDLLPPDFQLEVSSLEEQRNPYESVFVTVPATRTNISVAERMKNIDWRQKHISKNLENSWRNGRYFMYCSGTKLIPYKKFVDEYPKFQRYKKISNSICRKNKLRNSNSGRLSVNFEAVIAAILLKLLVTFS